MTTQGLVFPPGHGRTRAKTRTAARISLCAGGREWFAKTFAVHGHHYALAEVDGLEPGTVTS
ncbi:hypothetical protein GCM10009825_37680 [Arthrobacter humicola]|uniref:DUF7800 domain-containing protein n=1 Tax=Arthrobacter humicola TaxID=409291 RepID=A0ABN2ZP05_9MICC